MSIKNKNCIARLDDDQLEALRSYVNGRVVHDLGAGGLGLVPTLFEFGAVKVIAVDKAFKYPSENHYNGCSKWKSDDPRLELKPHYFAEYLKKKTVPVQVAVVSWPENKDLPGLVPLLREASKVIYIGCNTGGTACGNNELFGELRRRRVHEHLPARHNSLTVYGSYLKQERRAHNLTSEEFAQAQKVIVSFDESVAKRLSDRLDRAIRALEPPL